MKTKYEIVRAQKMGFCFGVMQAVQLCQNLLAREEFAQKRKYILGMLVHNEYVVRQFQEAGFQTIEEEEIENLRQGDIVVIRAHGISKEVHEKLKAKKVEIHDATCVFVSQIKSKILWAISQGYDIIFIGDKEHPEVKGLISYADKIQICTSIEEFQNLDIVEHKQYFLSTQTTLNRNQFLELADYIRANYKNIHIFDKICGATQERQQAAQELAKEVDVVLVLGGKKSSNTKKLYDISKSINSETYFVEHEEDLKETWLCGKKKIGITAGASTPEEVIRNIENKIRGILEMYNEEQNIDFATMLEDYLPTEKAAGKNQRVVGTINDIDRSYVYLDVPGQRTVVRVRAEEVAGYGIGDQVEVVIVGLQEDDDDQEVIIASRRRIELEENWKHIEEAFENKTVLTAKIVRKIKGGYIVEAFTHQGFLPNSLSEINEKDGDAMVGKTIDVIVKDIKQDARDKRNKKLTFSKRDITLMHEGEEFAKLSVGEVVDAVVTAVMDFGLSVTVGHLRGFIHISEVSWKRLEDLKEAFTVGQEVKAKILSLDEEKKNMKLSIKQLTENPWDASKDAFHEGDEVEGKVTRVLAYGAFVELTEGVEGLVHVSDFAWNKKRVHMDDYAKLGDTVKVKVLEFNPEARKLKLGFKQLVENPWENAVEKFGEGAVLEATVLEVKPFGLFAEIESGVDVFVHSSDYVWAGEEHPSYKAGDKITVKVLELNTEDQKVKGSIKALTKSPWDKAMEEYKVGLTVEKKIKNIMDFGLFVELSKGIDGFIPTQFASKDFIKNLQEKFEVGQVVKAQIVEINPETQKIKLSIKKIELEEERRENQDLLAQYGTAGE